MDDNKIIALYWQRNQAAISESQNKYGGFCSRIAFHILGDPMDTEECVWDTWQKSWETIPPVHPDSLSAFFGRIVRNLSLSRYRKNKAQKRFAPMDQLLSELEDCIPAPRDTEHMAEAAELAALINRWLETLDQQERILFVRRYWYGEPLSALAKSRGMTPNALSQKMFRLRQRLKTALEKAGYSI